MAIGFGACMPRRPTFLSAAGDQTLFCYLLHVPLTPMVQSSFGFALLEAASPTPRSPSRGAAMLGYMLAVQLVLSRKPSLPFPPLPSSRAVAEFGRRRYALLGAAVVLLLSAVAVFAKLFDTIIAT